MMIFDLYCIDEREFTPHMIEEIIETEQTITCLKCGRERIERKIRLIGTNINIKKDIYDAFVKHDVLKEQHQ